MKQSRKECFIDTLSFGLKFSGHMFGARSQYLGVSSGVGTPLPIPNRAVKHSSADGTPLAGESRSTPRYCDVVMGILP